LVSQGIKVTTDVEGSGASTEESGAAPVAEKEERKIVAPGNEELLRSQNEALWKEYIDGGWAHTSLLEPGGLVCRMPMQIEMLQQMRRGITEGPAKVLRGRLEAELPDVDVLGEGGRSKEELFDTWSKNTNYCYRLAEAIVSDLLDTVAAKADSEQRLRITDLDAIDRELLLMYASEQEAWQSVCLVLSCPEGSTTIAGDAVALNRPLGLGRISEMEAGLILNGQPSSGTPGRFDDTVVKGWMETFASSRGLYAGGPVGRGGPQDSLEPATLVHGFEELPGAEEIAPGTKIYTGGVEAAIDAVRSGKYNALDFRWFLGRHKNLNTANGKWLPVACARPVALKQCLGLPKPLWHEVLELCGGEPAEISRLEFQKRMDLNEE